MYNNTNAYLISTNNIEFLLQNRLTLEKSCIPQTELQHRNQSAGRYSW